MRARRSSVSPASRRRVASRPRSSVSCRPRCASPSMSTGWFPRSRTGRSASKPMPRPSWRSPSTRRPSALFWTGLRMAWGWIGTLFGVCTDWLVHQDSEVTGRRNGAVDCRFTRGCALQANQNGALLSDRKKRLACGPKWSVFRVCFQVPAPQAHPAQKMSVRAMRRHARRGASGGCERISVEQQHTVQGGRLDPDR